MTEVSVLIPTFRRPNSFVRAVRSVFAQRRDGIRSDCRRQFAGGIGVRYIPQARTRNRQFLFVGRTSRCQA